MIGEDVKNTVPLYSMGVAQRLTGLTGRQIRYWEQHGLVAPARTEGRQRLYSQADIERLKEVKRLLGAGMSLQRVKSYLAARQVKRRPETGAHREHLPRLTSVYPLTNRAELMRVLHRDDR